MEAIIELILDNPLYGVGLAALLLLLLFSVVKRMMKVFIIAIVLSVAYIYYLNDAADDVLAKSKEKAENLIDDAGSLFK